MKPKRIPLEVLVTVLAWTVTANVLALSQEGQNWNVDGMNGGVRVNATLVDSPCSLSMESENQEIPLGAVPRWQLNKTGDLSEPVKFHLILEDCMVEETLRAAEYGDNLMWLPGQPSVMLSFIGEEATHSPDLFQIHGQAKGVALRLEDAEHHQIHPAERTRPQILYPGRNVLSFDAQLSRLNAPLVEGHFRTVISFALEYH